MGNSHRQGFKVKGVCVHQKNHELGSEKLSSGDQRHQTGWVALGKQLPLGLHFLGDDDSFYPKSYCGDQRKSAGRVFNTAPSAEHRPTAA